MEARSLVKRAMIETLKIAGIDVHVSRKSRHSDLAVINRNYLSRYYEDNSFRNLYVEAMTKTNSGSRDSFEKQCRFYGLYQAVRRMLDTNVPGEFAECGCWRGHSALMTAKLIHEARQERNLHIFDSFEGGLSDKLEEDKGLLATVEPDAMRKEKEAFCSTEEEVLRGLAGFNFVTLHKGWIPERFSNVKDRTFALVNLSKGGLVVIDDYGTTDWPGVTTAVDQFLEQHPVTFAIETLGSMMILK